MEQKIKLSKKELLYKAEFEHMDCPYCDNWTDWNIRYNKETNTRHIITCQRCGTEFPILEDGTLVLNRAIMKKEMKLNNAKIEVKEIELKLQELKKEWKNS